MTINLVRTIGTSALQGEVPSGFYDNTTGNVTTGNGSSDVKMTINGGTGVSGANLYFQRGGVNKWTLFSGDDLSSDGLGIFNKVTSTYHMWLTQTGAYQLGPSSGSNNLVHSFISGSGTMELKLFSTNAGASATALSIRNSSGTADNDGIKFVHGAGVTKFQGLTGTSLGQVDVTNVGAWTLGNTTTTSGRHFIQNFSNGGLALTISNSATSTPNGIQISLGATPNNGTQYFLVCSDSTTTRMQVFSNGGISNFSANNTNLSDARIKSNIVDTASQLDFIKALKVRNFEYSDALGRIVTGLIAQEVEAVDSALVSENGGVYTVNGETFTAKAIHTDLIYHRLIKAVQELAADYSSYKLAHP